MLNVLQTFEPSPVLFSGGPLVIYWYGFFGAVGILLGYVTVIYLARHYDLPTDKITNLFIGTAIFIFIGARLYHVINEIGYYSEHFFEIFKVWQGGLALHGGILGGFLFGWIWIQKHNVSWLLLADIFLTAGLILQFMGRLGNYFNQELFGAPTALPWGIIISPHARPVEYINNTYFHPTFLYEALFLIIIFGILFSLHHARFRGTLKLKNGTIFLWYLLLYSLVRFGIELLRIDTTPILYDVRLPQLVSIIIVITILVVYIRRLYIQKIKKSDETI